MINLIQKFREKYKLEKDTYVTYTDASKMITGKSVGIEVVIGEEETAYKMSINPKCSVFTGEIIGIENALYNIVDKNIDRDILIY